MNKYITRLLGATAVSTVLLLSASAQVTVQENFNTGPKTLSNKWIAISGACLTAGSDYYTGTIPYGIIPSCTDSSGNSNDYYKGKSSTLVGGYSGSSLPDAAYTGALRLTNGASSGMASSTNGNNETGAIISANSFQSNQGLHITFNTLTWGGNAYNNGSQNSGADGINFFLLDASQFASTKNADGTYNVSATGSFGGALGYDCSPGKSPPDGFAGGFLGLGIDEYGNYANKGDNGNASDPNSPGFLSNAITLRGPGNITSAAFPVDSNGKATGVNPGLGPIVSAANVCQYGFYTTASAPTSSTTNPYNGSVTSSTTTYTPNLANNTVTQNVYSIGKYSSTLTQNVYPIKVVNDYPILATNKLAKNNPIFNQEYIATPKRTAAIPISYTVDITSTGLLSISYAYNGGVPTPVITNTSILDTATYPNTQIPGLPDNFLYGFAAGTGGGSNNHEITCFKAAQYSDSSSSASGNIPQHTRVTDKSGEQIYLASYNPTYWSGSLTATGLYVLADGSVGIGNVDANGNYLNSQALWDAGCVLTGTTTCPTSQVPTGPQTNRYIATWSGSNWPKAAPGVALSNTSLSGIPAATATLLNNDGNGVARLAYLMGERKNETGTNHLFRTRRKILGDIIDSSPVSVGAPSGPFPQTGSWVDAIRGSADPMPEGNSYGSFVTKNSARLNVVLVGANDGFLHAFQAGTWSGGTFSQTNNNGVEAFAYAPSLALSTIHSNDDIGEFDYSGLLYAHNAYVDATPGTGDLYYGGNWHTWAVGGTGAGGNITGINDNPSGVAVGTIYALEITNIAVPESSTSVASRVMGDWNSNTITCDNVSNCGQNLGSSYGTPIIKRMHSGNWAIIFGNGLNSANGTGGIFIGEVTGSNPTVTFHYIDTGAGPVTDVAMKDSQGNVDKTKNPAANGIAYAAGADLDGDNIVDYIYAGDAVGNLWRFDVTSTKPSDWTSTAPFNLFNASTSSGLQPITTAPVVSAVTTGTTKRVMINFGTGRQYPQSLSNPATYAPANQALYGIWDWNLSAWNALNSTQYVALSTSPGQITSANLTTQKVTLETLPTNSTGATSGYTSTNSPVCFPNSTACTGSVNPSYGWILPLPNTAEQSVFNGVANNGIFFISSLIPGVVDNLSCNITKASGYTYAVDVETGGANVGVFNNATGTNASTPIIGIGINGVGTPYFATALPASSTTGGGSSGPGSSNCVPGTPNCTGTCLPGNTACTPGGSCIPGSVGCQPSACGSGSGSGGSGNPVTTMISQTNSGTASTTVVNLGSNCTGNAQRLTWLEIR